MIFDCESRLSELAEDFNAIMYRQKAKAKEADETIYWDFNDIVEFANEHDALISIHAGRKVNGIDKELPNSKALPHQFAAKMKLGKNTFFEVGQKRDIDDYKKYIWPSVGKNQSLYVQIVMIHVNMNRNPLCGLRVNLLLLV